MHLKNVIDLWLQLASPPVVLLASSEGV